MWNSVRLGTSSEWKEHEVLLVAWSRDVMQVEISGVLPGSSQNLRILQEQKVLVSGEWVTYPICSHLSKLFFSSCPQLWGVIFSVFMSFAQQNVAWHLWLEKDWQPPLWVPRNFWVYTDPVSSSQPFSIDMPLVCFCSLRSWCPPGST